MYTFKASYGIHEGGTKYYQVIYITNQQENRSVVITHWGAYKTGCPRAPKLHGLATKVDVYKNSYHAKTRAGQIIRDKSKRGYGNWDDFEFQESSNSDFYDRINDWFKSGDVKLIFSHLTNKLSGESADLVIFDEVAEIDPDVFARNKMAWENEKNKKAEEAQALLLKQERELKQNEKWGMF